MAEFGQYTLCILDRQHLRFQRANKSWISWALPHKFVPIGMTKNRNGIVMSHNKNEVFVFGSSDDRGGEWMDEKTLCMALTENGFKEGPRLYGRTRGGTIALSEEKCISYILGGVNMLGEPRHAFRQSEGDHKWIVCDKWSDLCVENAAAVVISDYCVLVCGGAKYYDAPENGAVLMYMDKSTVEKIPSMVIPRAHHAAARLPNGDVLVTGGISIHDREPVRLSEIYRVQLKQWEFTPPMLLARYKHTLCTTPGGTVLAIGGCRGGFVEEYSPTRNIWQRTDEYNVGFDTEIVAACIIKNYA